MRTSATSQFATALASILVCLLTGCTTVSPVAADPTGTRIRAEIKAGDTVRVVSADGASHRFQISAVGELSLIGNTVKDGTEAAGMRIELPYRSIRQIDVERVSGVKTTVIVAAVALAAAIAIATGGGSHTPGYNR